MPRSNPEFLAFARGIACTLTWTDYRCACGAGTWEAVSADYVACQVCDNMLGVSGIAADVTNGTISSEQLINVKMPTLRKP